MFLNNLNITHNFKLKIRISSPFAIFPQRKQRSRCTAGIYQDLWSIPGLETKSSRPVDTCILRNRNETRSLLEWHSQKES